MSRRFSQGALCAITIIAIVLVSIILPLLSYVKPEAINNFDFKSAYANLDGYELSNTRSISLAGEWEFYWNKHLVSEGISQAKPDLYTDIPSAWTTYKINGKKLPGSGKASYKAVVENIKSTESILVSVNNLPGRCKVYIDDAMRDRMEAYLAEYGAKS